MPALLARTGLPVQCVLCPQDVEGEVWIYRGDGLHHPGRVRSAAVGHLDGDAIAIPSVDSSEESVASVTQQDVPGCRHDGKPAGGEHRQPVEVAQGDAVATAEAEPRRGRRPRRGRGRQIR